MARDGRERRRLLLVGCAHGTRGPPMDLSWIPPSPYPPPARGGGRHARNWVRPPVPVSRASGRGDLCMNPMRLLGWRHGGAGGTRHRCSSVFICGSPFLARARGKVGRPLVPVSGASGCGKMGMNPIRLLPRARGRWRRRSRGESHGLAWDAEIRAMRRLRDGTCPGSGPSGEGAAWPHAVSLRGQRGEPTPWGHLDRDCRVAARRLPKRPRLGTVGARRPEPP